MTRVVGELARREILSHGNAGVDRQIFGLELEDARRNADQNGRRNGSIRSGREQVCDLAAEGPGSAEQCVLDPDRILEHAVERMCAFAQSTRTGPGAYRPGWAPAGNILANGHRRLHVLRIILSALLSSGAAPREPGRGLWPLRPEAG